MKNLQENKVFWLPVPGDLVKFHDLLCDLNFPIRIAKPTFQKFVKTTVTEKGVFLVLGQLDHEQKLAAAYADEKQAYADPCGPNTHEAYFWCLSSNNDNVIVIPRSFLRPV